MDETVELPCCQYPAEVDHTSGERVVTCPMGHGNWIIRAAPRTGVDYIIVGQPSRSSDAVLHAARRSHEIGAS